VITEVFYFFQTSKKVRIQEGFSKTGENDFVERWFFNFQTSKDFLKGGLIHNLFSSFHFRVRAHEAAGVADRRGFNEEVVGAKPVFW